MLASVVGCSPLAGDLPSARRYAEEGLSLQRSLGDEAAVAIFIATLTQILVAEGDVDQPEPLAREVLAGALELGSTRNEHFGHHYLGDCATSAPQGPSSETTTGTTGAGSTSSRPSSWL